MPPIRAFVAIRLDARVDRSISHFIDELRPLGAAITWTRPASLHITLKFLGARVDRLLVDELADSIAPLAVAIAPFSLIARDIGAFPSLARPRAIFVRLDSDALSPLAGKIEDVAVRLGFDPAGHPFTPHLTIGRVRSARGFQPIRAALESARDRDFGVSTIPCVAIYQSYLSSEGSRYEAIAEIPLGTAVLS